MHITHTLIISIKYTNYFGCSRKNVVKMFKPRPIWWRCTSYLFFSFFFKTFPFVSNLFSIPFHIIWEICIHNICESFPTTLFKWLQLYSQQLFSTRSSKNKKLEFVHNLQAFSSFLVTTSMWNPNSKALVSWKCDYGFSPFPSNKYPKKLLSNWSPIITWEICVTIGGCWNASVLHGMFMMTSGVLECKCVLKNNVFSLLCFCFILWFILLLFSQYIYIYIYINLRYNFFFN